MTVRTSEKARLSKSASLPWITSKAGAGRCGRTCRPTPRRRRRDDRATPATGPKFFLVIREQLGATADIGGLEHFADGRKLGQLAERLGRQDGLDELARRIDSKGEIGLSRDEAERIVRGPTNAEYGDDLPERRAVGRHAWTSLRRKRRIGIAVNDCTGLAGGMFQLPGRWDDNRSIDALLGLCFFDLPRPHARVRDGTTAPLTIAIFDQTAR